MTFKRGDIISYGPCYYYIIYVNRQQAGLLPLNTDHIAQPFMCSLSTMTDHCVIVSDIMREE